MTTLRSAAASALGSAPFRAALRLLERLDPGRSNLLAVLTYHRVTDAVADAAPGLLSADSAAFEEQVSLLARRYRVVDLDAVLDAHAGRRRVPPRAVLVTFDDAYRDVAEVAWPILRSHRLPATVFVPTDFPDAPDRTFWWDRLWQAIRDAPDGATLEAPTGPMRLTTPAGRVAAFRDLRGEVKTRPHGDAMTLVDRLVDELGGTLTPSPVLGWDALRELATDGMTLAPHTRSHPLLPQVSATELDDELRGSRRDLEAKTGHAPPALAYPSGAHSPAVRAAAAAAGYRLAFTTERGINDLDATDPLRLRRINVGVRSSLAVLRAQLGSWAVAWSR